MSDICSQVAKGLAAAFSGLNFTAIYDEWPNHNETMALPALSINCTNARFKRSSNPEQLTQGSVVDNIATSTYFIGDYDLNVQLDIWARYKPERATLYRELFDLLQAPLDGSGLIISLPNYFSQKVALTEVGHRLPDSPELSSRQEWRATLEFEASVNAVVSRDEYIMTEVPEITFTTPNQISEE